MNEEAIKHEAEKFVTKAFILFYNLFDKEINKFQTEEEQEKYAIFVMAGLGRIISSEENTIDPHTMADLMMNASELVYKEE